MSAPTDDNKQLTPSPPDLKDQAIAEAKEPAKQPPLPLHDAVQEERTELMQIHAMLRCLTDVLRYSDDDNCEMHADVASVCARLLNDSITRLDSAVMRHLQGDVAASIPSESPAVDPSPVDSGETP